MLTVHCPKCGQALRLFERHLGVKGKCLKCAEPIIADRSEATGAVEIMLLAEHRPKMAVATPIESACAEWTPFEMAIHHQRNFAPMKPVEPSAIPPQSPFGGLQGGQNQDLESPDGADVAELDASTGDPADVNVDTLPGSSAEALSDQSPGKEEDSVNSPSQQDAPLVAAKNDDQAMAASGKKISTAPLAGLPGLAAFPSAANGAVAPSQDGEVADEVAAVDEVEKESGPQSPLAFEAREGVGDSSSLPWMEALAENDDSNESGNNSESDAVGESKAADVPAADSDEQQVPANLTVAADADSQDDDAATTPWGPLASSGKDEVPADDAEATEVEAGEETAEEESPVSAQEPAASGGQLGVFAAAAASVAASKAAASKGADAGKEEASERSSEEASVAAEQTDEDVVPNSTAEWASNMNFGGVKSPAENQNDKSDNSEPSPESGKNRGFDFERYSGAGKPGADADAEIKSDAPTASEAVDSKSEVEMATAEPVTAKPAKPAESKKEKGGVEGADPNMAMVPTLNMVRDRRKRRNARRRRRFMVFLLLLAGGAGGLMYFKPGFQPKSLQAGVMAAVEEGKRQLGVDSDGFDVDKIIAPLKELWAVGAGKAKPNGDAGATEITIPDKPKPVAPVEPAPVLAETRQDAKPEAMVAAKPADDAVGQVAAVEAIPPVAVATATPVAATVGKGGTAASAVDIKEIGLTRSSPGEDKETRRVRLAGEKLLKQFYAARSVEEKLAFVLSPGKVAGDIEGEYPSPVDVPSIRSMLFKGKLVDSGTQRAFGVFDVRENENGDRHRWCVPETSSGTFQIDWQLYQQLANDELTRFLATPGAPPETFRLLLRRGPVMAESERPWNQETLEMLLLMPLDDGEPSRLLVTRSSHDEFGLDAGLADGAARVGLVQLGWVEAESEEGLQVPTIIALERWGAWD